VIDVSEEERVKTRFTNSTPFGLGLVTSSSGSRLSSSLRKKLEKATMEARFATKSIAAVGENMAASEDADEEEEEEEEDEGAVGAGASVEVTRRNSHISSESAMVRLRRSRSRYRCNSCEGHLGSGLHGEMNNSTNPQNSAI
jgi:hypothetical protein